MNAPPFQFPVISICRTVGPYARPDEEHVTFFLGEADFAVCTSWDLKFHARVDMFLADSAGRCWRIVKVHDLGATGSLLERIILSLLQQRRHRVSCELDELEAIPLSALKARVCAAIAGNPDPWRDDEAIAGEDGPPRDEQEMLDELQDKVRKAQSVPQIINALYDENLPG